MNPKLFFKSTFALATVLFVFAVITLVATLEFNWFSFLSTPECVLLSLVVLAVFITSGLLIAASLYALHEDSASYIDASIREQTGSIINHIGTLSTSYSNRNVAILDELKAFKNILQESLKHLTNSYAKALESSSETNALHNYMNQIESLVAFAESSKTLQDMKVEELQFKRDKLSKGLTKIESHIESLKYINEHTVAISKEIASENITKLLEGLSNSFEASNLVEVLQVLKYIQDNNLQIKVTDINGTVIPASELPRDYSEFMLEFEQLVEKLRDVKNQIYVSDADSKAAEALKDAEDAINKSLDEYLFNEKANAKSDDLSKANAIQEDSVEA